MCISICNSLPRDNVYSYSLAPVTIGKERILSQHWYSDWWIFVILYGLIYIKYMLGAPIQALALYISTPIHTAVLLVKRFSIK